MVVHDHSDHRGPGRLSQWGHPPQLAERLRQLVPGLDLELAVGGASATAANADRLGGVEHAEFVRGGNFPTMSGRWRQWSVGGSDTRLIFSSVEIILGCANNAGQPNLTTSIRSASTAEARDVFIDDGGANPSYARLAAFGSTASATTLTGNDQVERLIIQAGSSSRTVTVILTMVNDLGNTNDTCLAQGQTFAQAAMFAVLVVHTVWSSQRALTRKHLLDDGDRVAGGHCAAGRHV